MSGVPMTGKAPKKPQESKWVNPLCGACGAKMRFGQSDWVDRAGGWREVVWHCDGCGDDFVEEQAAFDLRSNARAQWLRAPDLGLQALVFDVEGWPVKTDGTVLQHQWPGTGEWHVMTATGELLDEAPLVDGGPLDRLITGLINQRLKALRSGVPDGDPHGEKINLGRKQPELRHMWGVTGPLEHRLHLELDGWPLGVEQHLTAIRGEPRQDDPRGRHHWYVVTPERGCSEQPEGLPKGSIGERVAMLCQERLEQLRRWDEMRRRKRR